MAIPDFSSYTVANLETTSSTKFDNFVTAVQTALNNVGDATKTTWASGQILAPNQISQGGAANRQALIWNGSAWAPGSMASILSRNVTSTQTIANTVTETDLFTTTTGSGYLTIPAGTLTSTGSIRVKMGGLYLNNTGANRTLRLKVRYGASSGTPSFTTWTALWDSNVSDNIAASANNRAWDLDFTIQALNATNSQNGSGLFTLSSATAPTVGTGPLLVPTSQALLAPFVGAATTVDFTADAGIVVSAIHSTNSASLSISTTYARIEVAS